MKKKQIFNHSFNLQQPAPANTVEQLMDTALKLHQQGQLQQAEQHYRQILKIQPKYAYVLNLLGILTSQYYLDHQQAEKLIKRAIKIEPDVPDYYANLGLSLLQQEKFEETAKVYKKATRLNPKFANAWFGLGNANMGLKNLQEAIQAFQKATQIAPNFLPAYNNLGNIYREIGQFDEALAMFNKVLELKPDMAEAWFNIGLLYKTNLDGKNAVDNFTKATEIKPDYSKAYFKMGVCYYQLLNDSEQAIQYFDKTIEIDPAYVSAYLHKASVLQGLGQFDEAGNIIRQAIDIDVSAVDGYLGIVIGQSYNEKDLSQLQGLLDDDDLDIKKSISIYFSLGRIFDDQNQYEKAFQYFKRGNELNRSTQQFDLQAFEQLITRVIETFDGAFIQKNAEFGSTSELPVFIVGMPRSGTTLVEQIIAAHPDVYGAGELPYMRQRISELSNRYQHFGQYPEGMRQLTGPDLTQLSEDYLNEIKQLDNKATRITDKFLQNFIHLGLIAMLYPKARIIHCQREPLDTCLSIYFQHFEDAHTYAYDLTDIGYFYRQYRRLMGYWQERLPQQILTIQYEDLVEDLEHKSRELIEHIGLPWDERCLRFYEDERIVKTASQWQVRQPLYKTSIGRWKNYDAYLGPLKEVLGTKIEA